jgi:hypothetical protein
MVDEDRIEFDEERIFELIKEYKEAELRRTRRDIETEVLAETVWKAPKLGQTELIITAHQVSELLKDLTKAIEDGDEQGAAMIRRIPYFWLTTDRKYR